MLFLFIHCFYLFVSNIFIGSLLRASYYAHLKNTTCINMFIIIIISISIVIVIIIAIIIRINKKSIFNTIYYKNLEEKAT